MRPERAKFCSTVVLAALFAGCTPAQEATPTSANAPAPSAAASGLAAGSFVNTVWRVTSGNRAPGTLFVFLPNGTLMMTSCVEVYRLATWRTETAQRVTIVEDTAVEYTADIQTVSEDALRLRLNLRSEQVELTFEAAPVPFVCPDLPR